MAKQSKNPYDMVHKSKTGQLLSAENLDNSIAKKNIKIAFTLVEVLVTLAIIGIISALVITVVSAEYKKRVFVVQLQKNYKILNDAFQQAMINDKATEFGQTQIIQTIKGSGATNATKQPQVFWNELGRVLKIVHSYNRTEAPSELKYSIYYLKGTTFPGTFGNSYPSAILNDGTVLYILLTKNPTKKDMDKIKSAGGKMWTNYGFIYLDLNGAKEPNTYGRDIFQFNVSQDGMVIPYGSMDSAIFIDPDHPASYYWSKNNGCTTKSFGWVCAARVIEEHDMKY